MLKVPILRAGKAYYSKDTLELTDYASGQPLAEMSQANAGLISRDLRADAWSELQDLPSDEILQRFQEAARHFSGSRLPVGDQSQSAEEFVAAQSASTGLPYSLCRENMKKVAAAMLNMGSILDGLTGGLELATLDAGYGTRNGHTVSYAARARRFGAVLPANSPGVHALWLPAVALKMPLALKPGQREPWTPLRILESFRAAGLPDSGFGFYPCSHSGATTILQRCGASMMFGAGPSVKAWQNDPRVEIHGPGYSKIVFGPDKSKDWHDHVELIYTSAAANGGRSCINASAVYTTSDGRALALALAERMACLTPRPRDDPEALLAAFADPAIAQAIDAAIERGLDGGGAEDLCGRFRDGPRLVQFEGGTYLLPTVIYCETADHPLANQEYLFPFVSVVETPAEELLDRVGPSLVVTALTEEPSLLDGLMARCDVGRLNLGPIPTNVIQWDQPHEGNLFEHLYQQRAFQQRSFAAEAL